MIFDSFFFENVDYRFCLSRGPNFSILAGPPRAVFVAAISLCCGGGGGAAILPVAEEVAATGAPGGSLLAGNEVGGIAAPGAPNGSLLAVGGLWRLRVF